MMLIVAYIVELMLWLALLIGILLLLSILVADFSPCMVLKIICYVKNCAVALLQSNLPRTDGSSMSNHRASEAQRV